MRAAIHQAAGTVTVGDVPDAALAEPTDAIVRVVRACVCGSDLWSYRGINAVDEPTPIGHEYVGVVEATGAEVSTLKEGQFVIGSFFASDNTCPNCQAGFQTACQNKQFIEGAQAE